MVRPRSVLSSSRGWHFLTPFSKLCGRPRHKRSGTQPPPCTDEGKHKSHPSVVWPDAVTAEAKLKLFAQLKIIINNRDS